MSQLSKSGYLNFQQAGIDMSTGLNQLMVGSIFPCATEPPMMRKGMESLKWSVRDQALLSRIGNCPSLRQSHFIQQIWLVFLLEVDLDLKYRMRIHGALSVYLKCTLTVYTPLKTRLIAIKDGKNARGLHSRNLASRPKIILHD